MDTDSHARAALLELRRFAEGSEDGSVYGDRARAISDIDNILQHPHNSLVKVLLLPTGNLQELSIENGWGQQFMELASQLERILGVEG